MSLKALYSDGSSSTRAYSGSSYVANRNSNPEGDSWNIADMDRLVSVSGGMLWVQGDGTDPETEGDQLVLMGFDTDDGKGERVILPQRRSYVKPRLTSRACNRLP